MSWKSSEGERVKREWAEKEKELEETRVKVRLYMQRLQEKQVDVERIQLLNNLAYDRAWLTHERQYSEAWDDLQIMQHRQQMLSILQMSAYGNSYGGSRAGRMLHSNIMADIGQNTYKIAENLEFNARTKEMEMQHQKEQVDMAYKNSIKKIVDNYNEGEQTIQRLYRASERLWQERERLLDEIWSTKTVNWGSTIISIGIGALTGAMAMPAMATLLGSFGATAGIGATLMGTGLAGVATGAIAGAVAGGVYGFKHPGLANVFSFLQGAEKVQNTFAGLGSAFSNFGSELEKQYGAGSALQSFLSGGASAFEDISKAFETSLSPAKKIAKMERIQKSEDTMLSRGTRISKNNGGYDVLSGLYSRGAGING